MHICLLVGKLYNLTSSHEKMYHYKLHTDLISVFCSIFGVCEQRWTDNDGICSSRARVRISFYTAQLYKKSFNFSAVCANSLFSRLLIIKLRFSIKDMLVC